MAKTVSPVGGAKTVTTAGTAEALVASSTLATWVRITSKSGNTNPVYVGDSNVDNTTSPQMALASALDYVVLSPTEGFDIDLAEIYVDVTTNGEGVDFLYLA